MKSKKRLSWLHNISVLHLVLTCTVLFFAKSSCAEQRDDEFTERPFILAINRPEGSSAYTYLNMIYREVFRRFGGKFKLQYIPLKRGALESDSGVFDGETSRVYAYGDAHPNLVRVQEYLYSTDVSAYSANISVESLEGWESLKGTEYRIEYPRGVILSEINLQKVVAPEKLSNIASAEQGLQRLLLNRIDIYIDDDLVVVPLLKNSATFDDGNIQKIGAMTSVPLYMYIHKKNSRLEPILSEIIKGMRDDGLMEKYRKLVFGF